MAGRRVLVVDDDRDILEAAAQLLEAGGYEVRTAADGREALQTLLLGEWTPSVVVLDLMMPEVTGQAVLHMLSETPALDGVQVVVHTASYDRLDPVLERARCIVRKPSDEGELLAAVDEAGAGSQRSRRIAGSAR